VLLTVLEVVFIIIAVVGVFTGKTWARFVPLFVVILCATGVIPLASITVLWATVMVIGLCVLFLWVTYSRP
jgi:hypothetical protein